MTAESAPSRSERPLLLDAFCGAGGASEGYRRAGFDVVGVDNRPQPEYPFPFVQADALDFLRDHWHEFDVVAGSPPCHDHSTLSALSGLDGSGDLLDAFRDVVRATGLPYVIENVEGASRRMDGALRLCGTEFGLTTDGWWLARHRLFESNVPLWGAGGCHCYGRRVAGVYGHSDGPVYKDGHRGWSAPSPLARRLLGTPWISDRHQLAQAIPPAFTEFIGGQVLSHITREAVA